MTSERAKRALVYLDDALDELPDLTLPKERREQLQDEAARRRQRRREAARQDDHVAEDR